MSYFGTQIPLQSVGGMVKYERKILNTQTGKNPINSVKKGIDAHPKEGHNLEEKRREDKRREASSIAFPCNIKPRQARQSLRKLPCLSGLFLLKISEEERVEERMIVYDLLLS